MISSTLKKAALAATALLALSANAHMVMKTPIPLGKSTLNNSPLDPSGSDFPCKLRPGAFDAEGAQNVMAIGESQTLSFTGSAVHGGGSCQVSLTTDLEPTKDSKWMVIKSIEGGCPANVPGNLPADPNGSGASTFQYSIPEGIAPGQYTLAWTWLNKIGNREMYMNCAGVTVTASKKRYVRPVKRVTSLPEMVVCNLASINSCVTTENDDYEFPNPGPDVEKAGVGPYTLLAVAGGDVTPQQPSALPGSSGSSSQPPFASASPPTSAQSGAPAFASGPGGASATIGPTGFPGTGVSSSPAKTAAPGNFATGASSASVEVVPVTPSTAAIPVSTGASTGTDSGTSVNGSTPSTSDSGSCTPGDWQCAADGASFKRCVSGGTWSASMSMAAGMKCAPGVSANLNMSPVKAKRHAHHRFSSFLRRDSHHQI